MDEDYSGSWYPYEGGRSIGQAGWEDGIILRDEEMGDPDDPEDADARLTLERVSGENGSGGVSFALTCSLYGFMAQTLSFGEEAAARAAFDAAKPEMERLVSLIPYEEDGAAEVARKAQALEEASRSFADRLSKGASARD